MPGFASDALTRPPPRREERERRRGHVTSDNPTLVSGQLEGRRYAKLRPPEGERSSHFKRRREKQLINFELQLSFSRAAALELTALTELTERTAFRELTVLTQLTALTAVGGGASFFTSSSLSALIRLEKPATRLVGVCSTLTPR